MSSEPITRTGPLTGARNLVAQQFASWWHSGRWWRYVLIWTVIFAGLLIAMVWVLPELVPIPGQAATSRAEQVRDFPELGATLVAIGTVFYGQGLILDERRNGVLEWLLSKPLTHAGLVGAQFVAHGTWLAVSMIAVPWLAVYGLTSLAVGSWWSVGASMGAAALVMLVMLFHLALMLALGSFVTSRVTLLAIPLGLLVGIDLAFAAAPQLAVWSPWSVSALAAVMFTDGVLIDVRPVIATVVSIGALLTLAPKGLRHAMR